MRCSHQHVWLLVTGLILPILGLIAIFIVPGLIHRQVDSKLILEREGPVFEKWLNIPIPIYMHVYLYNWTNAEQVQNGSQGWLKPHFERIGPFVYREERHKDEIMWHRDKDSVSYQSRSYWYFEESMSKGNLDDNITALHVPSIAAAETMRDESPFKKKMFNSALNSNGGALFQTHLAREWLFEGFYDQFLAFALMMNSIIPSPVTSDHFAWFLERNGSSAFAGNFTIFTGQRDLRQRGSVKMWNGLNHTGHFEGACGQVNGSSPDLFMPHIEGYQVLTLFTPDACRGINLRPVSEATVHGVSGIRFETQADTFDNGQFNPDMSCYCPKQLQPDECPKPGATALGSCQHGAPVYLSHAGFMYADSSYTAGITGAETNWDTDRFYVVIEPTLGTPLEVNAAIQINLRVRPDKDITILENVEEFYSPMMVINTQAHITEELAEFVKFVNKLPDYSFYAGLVMIVLGQLFIICVLSLTIYRCKKAKKMDVSDG